MGKRAQHSEPEAWRSLGLGGRRKLFARDHGVARCVLGLLEGASSPARDRGIQRHHQEHGGTRVAGARDREVHRPGQVLARITPALHLEDHREATMRPTTRWPAGTGVDRDTDEDTGADKDTDMDDPDMDSP